VFEDARGFFVESYNRRTLKEVAGIDAEFVQDNHSRSSLGVLRGIHYQLETPQGKLVRATRGEVFDVAVDLRRSSPTLGRWVGVRLSEENKRQLWLPEGFGHAFLVLSPEADFLYKATSYYSPKDERCIRWDSESIGIAWPVEQEPIVSERDAAGASFDEAPLFD